MLQLYIIEPHINLCSFFSFTVFHQVESPGFFPQRYADCSHLGLDGQPHNGARLDPAGPVAGRLEREDFNGTIGQFVFIGRCDDLFLHHLHTRLLQNTTTTQPYERLPMWHKIGGLMVTTSNPGLRVDKQDWRQLTLEAWPATWKRERAERRLYNRKTLQPTIIAMETLDHGRVRMEIEADAAGESRAWVVRFHLRRGQRLRLADDNVEEVSEIQHIAPLPLEREAEVVPFAGKDAPPAPHAGFVAQVVLPSSATARHLDVVIE